MKPFCDIGTRLYLRYSSLIKNDAESKKVLEDLKRDPRVGALEGKVISLGGSATQFNVEVLAMWYVWAISEYGYERATKNLNSFLDEDKRSVMLVLWILGVHVEQKLLLDDGFAVMPIKNMPDSVHKEEFLMSKMNMTSRGFRPVPDAAIVCNCEVMKSEKSNEGIGRQKQLNADYVRRNKKMYLFAFLFNVIDGLSCLPYFMTTYSIPDMPLGLFHPSSGSYPYVDVLGDRINAVGLDKVSEINFLLNLVDEINDQEYGRYLRVLDRFAKAKRGRRIEDKVLDLGIALEMLLLDDNMNNEQLSLQFRLRGSWLIGHDAEDRLNVYESLKEIYKFRSQVAHGGVLCKNSYKKINQVREAFLSYESVAGRIMKEAIIRKKIEWDKLLLGCS